MSRSLGLNTVGSRSRTKRNEDKDTIASSSTFRDVREMNPFRMSRENFTSNAPDPWKKNKAMQLERVLESHQLQDRES